MATFRNAQIEDILNNERTMNRVILDRTSAHISAIGDERAPPTARDIKNEALLGSQIDVVKEKINKAIQLISALQYGTLDNDKIEKLNKMSSEDQTGISKYILDQQKLKADEEKTEAAQAVQEALKKAEEANKYKEEVGTDGKPDIAEQQVSQVLNNIIDEIEIDDSLELNI